MKRMVIALAALVLMGVGGTAIWSHHRSGDAETARAEVIGVAPTLVEKLLSYNSDTVDDDLARAAEAPADRFRTVSPNSDRKQLPHSRRSRESARKPESSMSVCSPLPRTARKCSCSSIRSRRVPRNRHLRRRRAESR